MNTDCQQSSSALTVCQASWERLEAYSNFSALVDENIAESALAEMPPPYVDFSVYRARESTGLQSVFLAIYEEQLIGFAIMLLKKPDHYGAPVGVVESLFVTPKLRRTGAGLRLLRAAEKKAAEIGCCSTLVTAPLGSILHKILPRVGYSQTTSIFIKKIKTFSAEASSAPCLPVLRSSSSTSVAKVRQFEQLLALQPQVNLPVHNALHAGMYSRTLFIPAGVVVVGALVKIPTLLAVNGNAVAYIGDEAHELQGYNVLAAEAHRKQVVFAKSDVLVTMSFATDAKTVEEAEEQFTDETHLLQSRQASYKEWEKLGSMTA